MKKRTLILCLFTITAIFVHAEKRYVTKMIYPNGSIYYDVNDRGELAFIGVDAAQNGRQQVYLYSGGKLQQITTFQFSYSYSLFGLDMNNKGQIVWTMYSNEGGNTTRNILMFWDGLKLNTIRIDNLYWNQEIYCMLNDAGTIVWHATPAYGVLAEVYSVTGNSVKNISNSVNNPDYSPVVSNDGWIAWYGDNRNQNQWWNRIRYLKPGETNINEIPDESSSFAKIGQNNTIIYQKLVNNIQVLKMFTGTTPVEIDDSIHVEGNVSYHICYDWIVYSKLNSSKKYDIYRYNNKSYTRVSKPGTDNYHAKVNKDGSVIWQGDNSGIYVYRGGEITQIGSGRQACHPLISDQGLMAWAGGAITNYYNNMYICEYKEVFDVTGKVVLENGTPLPDADISLNGTAYGKTGADGTFKVTDLDTGMVTITFNKSGYKFNPPQLAFRILGNLQITPDVVARLNTFANGINRDPGFEIFPNPAANRLTISLPNAPGGQYGVEIIDISGQVVYSGLHDDLALSHGLNIITKDFGKGQYFVRLLSGNKSYTKKLLVR